MKAETNMETVRSFIQAFWNEGNLACTDQYITEDYEDHAYVPNNVIGLKETARVLHTAFPDQCSAVESIVAQGDRVVVRLAMTGTHLGLFRGTEATGNRVDVKVYREYRLVNGKIAEHWALFDTVSLLRQIGAELHQQPACRIK
ncbi:ester cyclase [Paenibacillus sp. NPDC056579]|uniref:ester cyclase n=1 Tax=Paenibacillus sp. NPDC056579 TaxID=3345871 RepID=UPI00368A27EE